MSTQISISPVIKLEVNTTPITGGSAGQILFQTTGNTVGESSNLFWDATNNRLGIGTSLPAYQIHVNESNNTDAIIGVQSITARAAYFLINHPSRRYRVGANISVASAFEIYDENAVANRLTIPTTGNVLINTTTDAGFKLDVNGTAVFRGTLSVSTGGASITGNVHTTTGYYPSGTGQNLNLYGGSSGTANCFIFNTWGSTNTVNSNTFVNISRTYDPVGGTGVYTNLLLGPTINQTGGANGITRGLYVNPTLTAAADFRAIETTAGKVIFNGGNVGIGTSSPVTSLSVNGSIWTQHSSLIGSGFDTSTWNYIKLYDNITGDANIVLLNTGWWLRHNANASIAGKLLLGTTTDAGYKLDVNGAARVSGDLTLTTNQYFYGSGLRSGNALFWDQGGIGSTTDGNTFSNSYNLAGSKTLWLRGDPRFAYTTTPASVYYFGARYSGSASTYVPCDFMKLELSGLESWGISSGTNTSNAINIKLNLNYTGGTSTVRGIYYNPTLTSMTGVTHFAFHSTSGRVRFENLPTSSAGLSAGDIWNDAGTLKIV